MKTTTNDIKRIRSVITTLSMQLPILDAKRAGMELFGAPKFNAFSLFAPNENTISRIAEDLLDPSGKHGQGSLFLNILLQKIGMNRVGPTEPVRVKREVQTSAKRRIDLVIETPKILIGIENKPWAAQQQNQLSDYLAALKLWGGKKSVRLVFLSDQEPKTAEDEVVVVTYGRTGDRPSLQSILEESKSSVMSPRVRQHVEEFVDYIKEQFLGENVMTTGDEPYLEAVEIEFENSRNRRAIGAVILAQDRIHKTILKEIEAAILSRLDPDFEVVEGTSLSDGLASQYDPWLLRRSNWPTNLNLAIEAHGRKYAKVYYGVRAPDPEDAEVIAEGDGCPARNQIESNLSHVAGGQKTEWWPWWSYSNTINWTPDFTARILLECESGKVGEHPEIAALTEHFIQLGESIDQSIS